MQHASREAARAIALKALILHHWSQQPAQGSSSLNILGLQDMFSLQIEHETNSGVGTAWRRLQGVFPKVESVRVLSLRPALSSGVHRKMVGVTTFFRHQGTQPLGCSLQTSKVLHVASKRAYVARLVPIHDQLPSRIIE